MVYRQLLRLVGLAGCTTLALVILRPAAGQIVLDANFDHGSLNVVGSAVSGNVVTLSGRDNYNPGQWKWLYFSADGVADEQVTFRIGDNFAGGGSNLNGHAMVYSYDQTEWFFFDNNIRNASQDTFTFFNNQPFTQDRVWVAHGLPYPYSRTVNHVADLRQSAWVMPTASANADLAIGQSPGGVDDLGRNVASREIFGFKITDPAAEGPKTKVVLSGGVHANETLGNFTLEGLIDFLAGDTLEAAVLRNLAEFYVYPMVNPDGRHAGYNRSTVEWPSRDPNRYFDPPTYGGLDDIRVTGDAMIADTGANIDYLIDFHSDTVGKEGHYGYVLPAFQSDPFWQNLRLLEPEVRTENAELIDLTAAKFGRDELGAKFSMTFETQFLAGENIDRFLSLGRNFGLAFFETLHTFADLNLDGVLDGQDWLMFMEGSETDLTGLSPLAEYQLGDLDGDGVNSILDFGLFKTAYEQTNGLGSFATLFVSVPEPAGSALALIALLVIITRHRLALGISSRRKHHATH